LVLLLEGDTGVRRSRGRPEGGVRSRPHLPRARAPRATSGGAARSANPAAGRRRAADRPARRADRAADVEPAVHQHLYSWTFQTLSNLLARTGYEVIENRYRYGTMHYRLRYLGRLHYPSYDRLVRSLGRLLNRREMVTRAGLASPGFATG